MYVRETTQHIICTYKSLRHLQVSNAGMMVALLGLELQIAVWDISLSSPSFLLLNILSFLIVKFLSV